MGHGAFFWNELMTWTPERAKAFYGHTLGWTFEAFEMPGDEAERTYWVCLADGKAVGGIFTMTGGEFVGTAEHWFSYIEVDDVDARLAEVEAEGGTVLRAPFDIPGIGRVALITDPNGANIGWVTPAPSD